MLEELEEGADFEAALESVAHFDGGVDRVVVSAADAGALDVAGLDEVGDDALGGAFGDADLVGDVSHAGFGVVGDAEQHLGVAGDERPGLAVCP